MSDTAAWAAVGVSLVALVWTAVVDWRTRRDAKRQRQALADSAINSAISRVLATWAGTRLGTVNVHGDPNPDELKRSAREWRQACVEPLSVLPRNSRAHDLVSRTIEAADAFEATLDPVLRHPEAWDYPTMQQALTKLQRTVSRAMTDLAALTQAPQSAL